MGTVSFCTVWSTRTLTVRSRYCTLVRSRYAHGAVEVRSWCGRGMLVVRLSGRGTLVVRSRYTRGALPVRCVSLTFQRAILYISVVAWWVVKTLPQALIQYKKWSCWYFGAYKQKLLLGSTVNTAVSWDLQLVKTCSSTTVYSLYNRYDSSCTMENNVNAKEMARLVKPPLPRYW